METKVSAQKRRSRQGNALAVKYVRMARHVVTLASLAAPIARLTVAALVIEVGLGKHENILNDKDRLISLSINPYSEVKRSQRRWYCMIFCVGE